MTNDSAPREPALRPWREHLRKGVDPTTLDIVAKRSLPAAWTARWAADPGQVVLRSQSGGQLIAGELEDRSARAAARLAAAGVGPGDRVVVSAPASIELVVAYVGIQRLGAVPMPLNSAYTEREVARVVADARPVAAIAHETRLAGWIAAAAPAGCRLAHPDLTGLPPADAATAVSLDAAAIDDPALLCYTSGTTAVPKGVPLSHGNLLASAEAVRLAWRWQPDDELILCLPLFHLHGLAVGLHGTLVSGATARLFDHFDPSTVLAAARAGGSMFFGVPTMWHRLAADPAARDIGRLRLGVSGSAPLPVDLHAAIAALAGRPPLERYGMTETVMLVSNPYEGERRAGSVGFPLPGVEVRLTDEIEVRGPNVFAGYWQRPHADQVAFRDGWFRTGDLGATDTDGYLRIVGRAKELIISGGFNVFPREVEDVLRSHPAVDDAAVAGAPDSEWGERVCAFVVEADDVTDAELAAWCAARLAPYKRPRLWRRIGEIPHDALGKVRREVLVAGLAE
jgi:malonyl-CoA/methylmalonyl-CoA synthetase